MAITVESFNGKDIQSATYKTWLEVPDAPLSREADLRFFSTVGRR